MSFSDTDPALLSCPYCGEVVEVSLEADLAGEMVHDCEICCQPWRLIIRRRGEGRSVEALRLDD